MSREESKQLCDFLITGLSNYRNKIHLTNRNIRVLQNLVYNLYFNNSIKIDDKSTKYFNRNIKSLKVLANKNISSKIKRGIISSKRPLIRRIATTLKQYLEE